MRRSCSGPVAWLVYPTLLGGILALHVYLVHRGQSVLVSTYTPLVIAALLVAALERVLPYRREWLPERTDVSNDLLYMAVVQLALPKLLAFTVGLLFLRGLNGEQLMFAAWPHTLPVYGQLIFLILIISFVRYWVHRAAHEWSFLWRVHAVHHSPTKLYWLNLGRFHPLEEILRFVTEALPLVVIGVPEAMLAFYFVLLSTNGFLFHSNLRLKHGLLNYVFATAELHRWHHSRDPREAACNYGNLLIIWDALFGTRYLPPARDVDELGLLNRRYPRNFLAQLAAPFASGTGRSAVSRQSMASTSQPHRGPVQ